MARLVARVLGTFVIELDGRAIGASDFARRSARHLVQLLLVRDGHRVRREEVSDLLWPELDPERASANLRKALHFARQALGDDARVIHADAASVSLAPDVDLDLDRLLAGLRASDPGGRHEALELGWRPLLPDEPYEDWLVPLRTRLLNGWSDLARAAAEDAVTNGDRASARRLAERLLAHDPADEGAHRVLIRAYLEDGLVHAARRQLATCRDAVREAFGTDPEPETAALLDAVPRRPPLALAVVPHEPLVGRGAELDAIESALDAVDVRGRGGIVLHGEAGIGKTRLLEHGLRAVAAEAGPVIHLRGLEAVRDMPMASLAASLAAALGGGAADAWPEPARSAALTLVPAAAPDGSVPVVAFGSEAALRAGVVDALERAFGRRLAVAVDDAQWLDDGTLGVLAAAWSRGLVRALLATVRTGERRPPRLVALLEDLRRDGVRELEVGPLSRGQVAALARGELGDEVSTGLADALADRSAGNPLFCLELLRLGRERGRIARSPGGRWDLAGSADALGLPATVGRLVAARMGEVEATAGEVLVAAAELGHHVAFDVIARAFPALDAGALLAALDEGLRLEILREDGDGYAFTHPLFRAALRESMPRGRRAALHLSIARALAGDGDPTAAVHHGAGAGTAAGAAEVGTVRDATRVAHHALQAEAAGLAEARPLGVAFGLAAIEQLAVVFDHPGVLDLVPRVVNAWERLPAPERDRYPVTPALIRQAQALTALHREPEAAQALQRGRDLATTPDDHATAGREQSWLPYRHGDFEGSLAILRALLEELPPDAAHARATVEQQIGWVRLRQDVMDEAVPLLERSLATFEAMGDERWTLQVLDKLGVALVEPGTAPRGVRLLERSVAIARRLGDPRAELPAAMHLVSGYAELGVFERARASLARSLEIAPMIGEPYMEAIAARVGGDMETLAGEPERAIALYRRELEILASIGGNPVHEATTLATIAGLERRLGHLDAAKAAAEDALRRAALGEPDLRRRVVARLAEAGVPVDLSAGVD